MLRVTLYFFVKKHNRFCKLVHVSVQVEYLCFLFCITYHAEVSCKIFYEQNEKYLLQIIYYGIIKICGRQFSLSIFF